MLLDLWGKLDRPGAVYADITWMGFTGRDVPERFARAFDAVRGRARRGRRSGADRPSRAGRDVRGWEVDRAASTVLEEAGYGEQILHRTGHSLGETVHGNGVNMDDYETHDDRRLLPGTGFTIEPGVYFSDFGVRSEINHDRRGRATPTSPDRCRPRFWLSVRLSEDRCPPARPPCSTPLLIAVSSLAVGMVIASRLDLSPSRRRRRSRCRR